MNVGLIALPWSMLKRPSAALGALSPFLERHEPELSVTTIHAYVEAAVLLSPEIYDVVAHNAYTIGELLYAPLVHPEKTQASREKCAESLRHTLGELSPSLDWIFDSQIFGESQRTWTGLVDRIRGLLTGHLNELVDQTAGKFEVVGLTTSFGQLFANLAFAKRLKAVSPDTKIVLGGSTVSGAVGPSILKTYPFFDFIVQGEGERPLLALLQGLLRGSDDIDQIPGVLTRSNLPNHPGGTKLSEVSNMNDLPLPDFDEYAGLARKHALYWELPVEGSRGCWWDRTKRTGNPKSTCYFCNLNVQWNGYREKSASRLVGEVDDLTNRYGHGRIFFLDNIIRAKGILDLANGLKETGKDFSIFYEMRANVDSSELLAMWEAGLEKVQFGIEGLSTKYLKRIGKGTTAIQNLQAMKTCQELGIHNMANLLIDFPGADAEEIEETRLNILRYAFPFQPLNPCSFFLGTGSTVETLNSDFPVKNIRNGDLYRMAVPEEIYGTVRFFELSFDTVGETADWGPVREAAKWWSESYLVARNQRKPLMCYVDGGDYLRIDVHSGGGFREFVLRGLERDVYYYCLETRTLDNVFAQFAGRAAESTIRGLLDQWFEEDFILFQENGKCLSLAPAISPLAAARRIRALSRTKGTCQ